MLPRQYNIANLKQWIRDPGILLNEVRSVVLGPYIRRRYGAVNFLDQDWDNLIILDACRPEVFERCNPFEGKLSTRTSLGASSQEFFIETFRGNEYHDTVYVTGNANIGVVNQQCLHNIFKTYADGENHHPGWLPERTLEAAIEAYQTHPNKRLVVHFMQPHVPYIGDQAQELRDQLANEYGLRFRYMDLTQDEQDEEVDSDIQPVDLLTAFEQGYISRKEMEAVYKENLNVVLEYVAELLGEINGKTVITADHSESFGDFNGIYGHQNYALSKKMREVPWLEIDDTRRKIYTEPPEEMKSAEEEVVERNLHDLGYLE